MSPVTRRTIIKYAASTFAGAAMLPPSGMLPWAEALAETESGEFGLWVVKNISGYRDRASNQAFQGLLDQVGIPTPDAAIGEILNMIGLGGSSGPSPEAQKLDAIKQQLDAMGRTLDHLEQRIDDLQRQLDITAQLVNSHTTTEFLREPVNALDRLFGSSYSSPGHASLMALLGSAKLGRRVNIAAFRSTIESEVQPRIDRITDLLTTTVASNKSLLEQWTSVLVLQMPRDGTSSEERQGRQLVHSYRLLESYFTQALAAQMKGVILRAAAYGASGEADPMGRARADFEDALRSELDTYQWCVERLVLSQKMYVSEHDWFGPMDVIRRAAILDAVLFGPWNGQSSDLQELFGGTFGRVLLSLNETVEPGSRSGTVRLGSEPGTEIPGVLSDRTVETRGVMWLPEFEQEYQKIDPRPHRVRVLRTHQPVVRPGGPPILAGMSQSSLVPRGVKFWPIIPIDPVTFRQADRGGPITVHAGVYLDGRRVLTGPKAQPQRSGVPNTITQEVYFSELVDREVSRGPNFLRPGMTLGFGPAYTNKFTLRTNPKRFAGFMLGGSLQQSARMPLCMSGDPEGRDKLVLLVSGGAILRLLQPMYAEMPCRIEQRVKIAILADNGTRIPVYDSAGSSFGRPDRPVGLSELVSFTRIVPFDAEPQVKYDLLIEFLSAVTPLEHNWYGMSLNERVELSLGEVAIQRAQGVGFGI